MSVNSKRHVPLAGAYNFRDLGGYRTSSGDTTKWRRIIRADSPHRLTGGDIDMLLGEGLATVIDLRSMNEVENAPNPFATHLQVNYHNIGLFDHLSPDTIEKGLTKPSDDPLLDFYVTTLTNRQFAIRNVLEAIATAEAGTVLFHCTAGKDRTGLISALILGLAEVKEEDIVSDYAQTEMLISDLVLEFLELARGNGTDLQSYRRLLACNPETMSKVIKYIKNSHRSIPGFLEEIGLETETRNQLKARILS